MRFKCFSLFLPAFRDYNVVVFLQHTHTGWPQITTKSDDGFGHKVTLARVFGSDKNGALEVRFVTFYNRFSFDQISNAFLKNIKTE